MVVSINAENKIQELVVIKKKKKNLYKLGIEGKFQFDNKYLQKTYN